MTGPPVPVTPAGAGPDSIREFDLQGTPPDFIDDPYPYYERLRSQSPVHRMPSGGVLLSRYDHAATIYREPRASSDKRVEFRPKLGTGLLYEHHTTSLVFNDPPLHTRVRRLIMRALDQRAISRMEAALGDRIERLIMGMAEREEVNFIEAFAAHVPIEVIGNLLDVPHSARAPLRAWSVAILSALEPILSAESRARGERAVAEFLDFLRDLVAERRRRPGDPESDVLTRLMQGEKGDRLSDVELYHQCIFLLNAGHETTTNLLGNGMWLLLTHPDELARLRAAPAALLPGAIEEMLRYEGPIQLNNRRLTDVVTLGGEVLPAGTSITIAIGAVNRDPAQFAHPERFDIGRKPNRHLAFGHGSHACSGMNVARMEARVAFARLLSRFRVLELAGEPERDPRIRFRGFTNLPVRCR